MNELKILIKPEEVTEAILVLQEVEGIQVQLQVQEFPIPKEKEQGFHLDFPVELIPVVISITGMLTSFASLAAAILKLKSQQQDAKQSKEGKQPPLIEINQNLIVVNEFSNSQELAAYLEKSLDNKTTT